MTKIFEAIPLMVFLGYLRSIDTQIPENWKIPFVVSGCAAIIVIIFSLYKEGGVLYLESFFIPPKSERKFGI